MVDTSEYRHFLEIYTGLLERKTRGKISLAEISLLFMEYRHLRHMIVHRDGTKFIGALLTGKIAELRATQQGRGGIVAMLAGLDKGNQKAAVEGRTLVINPRTASTIITLFDGVEPVFEEDIPLPISHGDMLGERIEQVLDLLNRAGVKPAGISGISCKGGMVGKIPGGTYLADEDVAKDSREAGLDQQFNIGVPLALAVAEKLGRTEIPVTMTDPFSVDEMAVSSRMTGTLKFSRNGTGAHYLNHRASARLACALLGIPYSGTMLVSLHMGVTMSAARHAGGVIADVRKGFTELPGSRRCGPLPIEVVIPMLVNGEIRFEELRKLHTSEGGLLDLCGTDDFSTLMAFRDKGATDVQKAKIELVLDFFAHAAASGISSLTACDSKPSLLVITGGMAEIGEMVERVLVKMDDIFPPVVVPGSLEQEALAAGNIMVRADPSCAMHYGKEKLLQGQKREAVKKAISTPVFERKILRIKPGAPARTIDDVVQLARVMTRQYGVPRIGIVGANNEEVIDATSLANSEGRFQIAKFLLIGPFTEISRLAWEYDINIDNDNFTIIDTNDPIARSMELYKNGTVNMLMKGSITTESMMHAFLQTTKSMLSPDEKVFLSHVAVMDIPGYAGLVVMSDAAINPAPSRNSKIKILKNALGVAKALNLRNPKVAMISAVEKVNEAVASSIEAREIADQLKNETGYIIEGPLSVDVALEPKAAEEKGYKGRIRGDADVLIMPDIESGNVFYKSLTVGGQTVAAGAVVGGKVPVVLTSRGDSALTKLASISLGILLFTLQNIARNGAAPAP
jgi:phosphate butyryltransferase